uniref:Carboxylesterase type B domain-containing protein n=1 Tax=Trichogramma kaykai TaxID=54128 RepID=A0ABD2XG72_9HYME
MFFSHYRQGCIHGEELPYFFGAPLVAGLAHWPKNYTRTEVGLSESVILYLANFARTGSYSKVHYEPSNGLEARCTFVRTSTSFESRSAKPKQSSNPNEGTPEPGSPVSRPERSKLKNLEWTAYEAVHKKYISIENLSAFTASRAIARCLLRAARRRTGIVCPASRFIHSHYFNDNTCFHCCRYQIEAEKSLQSSQTVVLVELGAGSAQAWLRRRSQISSPIGRRAGTSAIHSEATVDLDARHHRGSDEPDPDERHHGPTERAGLRGVDAPAGGRLRRLQHRPERHHRHRLQPADTQCADIRRRLLSARQEQSAAATERQQQQRQQLSQEEAGKRTDAQQYMRRTRWGKGSLAGSGGGHHVSIERHHHMQHHHLPPAVFADPPNNHHHNHGISVPMPPPPPKNAKPSIIATSDKLQSNQLLQQQQNLIISPNHLQQVEMGMSMQQAGSSSTLKRQQQHHHQLANQQQQQQQHQQQQQTIMEELRV